MIRNRDTEDLDEDLWLLESRVRTLRLALIVLSIFVEAALFCSFFAIYKLSSGCFW